MLSLFSNKEFTSGYICSDGESLKKYVKENSFEAKPLFEYLAMM